MAHAGYTKYLNCEHCKHLEYVKEGECPGMKASSPSSPKPAPPQKKTSKSAPSAAPPAGDLSVKMTGIAVVRTETGKSEMGDRPETA